MYSQKKKGELKGCMKEKIYLSRRYEKEEENKRTGLNAIQGDTTNQSLMPF